MSSTGTSSSCCVKVGVRVRPLLAKERNQAVTLSSENMSRSSLSFKGQQYTFDHVFGSSMTQSELYRETAAPMLKGFLEGYNVTIMAYGQTGSGKSFTMGTSELQEETEMQGLIPRFVTDLFETLKQTGAVMTKAAPAQTVDDATSNAVGQHKTRVAISFLEIYGEDVYDLIGPASSSSSSYSGSGSAKGPERPSLPVREDEAGHVFVQGQHESLVTKAGAALELLSSGTRNRITASTAMNAGSSRSHAVFTVTLDQEITGQEEHDVHHMVSKLTFVDLAGSERIKRTCAEGQRLKEGIQINSGLFNLGQVINALADDQRLKQGLKAAHVPYRNSKLTHLLKDALGGNSQTLFLACVSPAESNESESHSTLNYARQARNIQNKPVKNMDKHQLELRRLKYALKAWMINACKHMFGLGSGVARAGMVVSESNSAAAAAASAGQGEGGGQELEEWRDAGAEQGDAPSTLAPAPASTLAYTSSASLVTLLLSPLPNLSPSTKGRVPGPDADDILSRPDVQAYIRAVNAQINERLQGGMAEAASSIVRRLSLGTPPRRPLHGNSHHLGQGAGAGGSRRVHGAESIVQRFAEANSSLSSVGLSAINEGIEGSDLDGLGADGEGLDSDQLFDRLRKGLGVSGSFADQLFGGPEGSVGGGPFMCPPSGNRGRTAAAHRDSMVHAVAHSLSRDSVFEATAPEETERLVSRMLEMVNKEKEMYVQDGREVAGDMELVAVDKAIEEKQEILSKLMDTVKGYSSMKADFEKLLGAIGNLETERRELEDELDRAKRAAEEGAAHLSGGSVVCPATLDRMKERFTKVKKELDDMREERKKKESAYRLMQKESKQCDALSKELKKLRDNKAVLVKQQRAQQQLFQRRQKEAQQKVAVLKRSDVKKQQQMNTLKSELVKKERVLGHKDREIGRINSKLRACEEHIGQLLKIQNRNRARITSSQGASGSAGGGAKGGGGGGGADHFGRAALSQTDLDHLLTSKAMLDNLVEDRVERHVVRRQFDRKTRVLQELNREMVGEAMEMEGLLARLKALGGSLDGPDSADDEEGLMMAGEAGLFSGDGSEDNVGDATSSSTQSAAAAAVAEEYRQERLLLRREIRVCETGIDRIARELDLYNADLDDLADRMEEKEKGSSGRPSGSGGVGAAASNTNRVDNGANSSNSSEAWEELGREIIAGLSLPQSTPLIWDLIGEKVMALETSRGFQEELGRVREQLESANDKLGETERQLRQAQSEMKSRLEKAEMQRVQDVWAVIKAAEESSPLGDSEAGAGAGSASALRAAIQRACELEREVETLTLKDESQLAATAQRDEVLHQLQSRCDSLEMRLRALGPNDGECDNVGDSAEGKENGATADHRGFAKALHQCFPLWDDLGLPPAEREVFIHETKQAAANANVKIVEAAQEAVDKARADIERYNEDLAVVCQALGRPLSAFFPGSLDDSCTTPAQALPVSMPLLSKITRLEESLCAAEAELRTRGTTLCSLKERLLNYVSEMWLETTQLTPDLQALMTLMTSGTEAEPVELARRVAGAGAGLTSGALTLADEQLAQWETSLRKLNVERAQTTNRLLALQKQGASLAHGLGLASVSALTAVVGERGLGESISRQAVVGAIELLADPPHSNPPGSAALLQSAECLLLVLQNVRFQRANVVELCRGVVEAFDGGAGQGNAGRDGTPIVAVIPAGSPNPTGGGVAPLIGTVTAVTSPTETHYTQSDVLCWIHRVEDLCEAAATSVPELKAAISAAIAALSTAGVKLVGSSGAGAGCGASGEQAIATAVEANIKQMLMACTVSASTAIMVTINQFMADLSALSPLVDELWLSATLEDLQSLWVAAAAGGDGENVSASGTDNVRHCLILRAELDRLASISDGMRGLRTLDGQLGKLVQEMETFEVNSKADRAKLLAGSSKALLEEEKFRKNGKKRYEALAERLTAAGVSLLGLVQGQGQGQGQGQELGHDLSWFELVVDFSGLSMQAQGLLRSQSNAHGRAHGGAGAVARDKAELMHLHTMAHGTRRWSDDSNDGEGQGAGSENCDPSDFLAAVTVVGPGLPMPPSCAAAGDGHGCILPPQPPMTAAMPGVSLTQSHAPQASTIVGTGRSIPTRTTAASNKGTSSAPAGASRSTRGVLTNNTSGNTGSVGGGVGGANDNKVAGAGSKSRLGGTGHDRDKETKKLSGSGSGSGSGAVSAAAADMKAGTASNPFANLSAL